MSTDCDHEAILAAFRSRRGAQRVQALRDAYFDPHADSLLARVLDDEALKDSSFEKVVAAAQLGDFSGEVGDDALRRAMKASGPGTTDVRCASVLALAKRIGARATPDLSAAFASSNGAVKDYAVVSLAGAGDDEAWEEVLAHLPALLRRQRRSVQSEVAFALAYLARHVNDQDRRTRLITFVRRHWAAIDEAEWFARMWPAAAPDGPAEDVVDLPDAERIQAWARDPLFRASDRPRV